ncbi:uncharacterized protein LOC105640677 isoform X2 [Jatropha curcas]|nr:uncharacterized protein LOC105640677 isoform X2 [Jatropha curcas]
MEENQSTGNESMSMDGSDSLCCGICLSDNRNSIRGQIDSCEHYFCFVCILEWAKVESRCPMCKRRFNTIRRPAKDGVFPCERVVNVPKRDQVYHLSGNASVAPFDPYARVQCSLCHSAKDECFLLLCDLCDSAAHTYCVGLGATVPEGDWFCNDCAVSRTEHDKLQKDNDDIDENLYVKSKVMLAAELSASKLDVNSQSTLEDSDSMEVDYADVSIFDIVHEPHIQSFHRQLTFSTDPLPFERRPNLADEMTQLGERTSQTNAYAVTPTGARTLSRCRNVHGYIRVLRENWSSLQSGSLRFSCSSPESSKSIGKCNTHAASNGSSVQPHSLSSTSGQQPTTKGTPDIFTQDRHYNDIDKAWKMMHKAKSIQQANGTTKSVDLVSKNILSKGKRKLIDGSSSLQLSRTEQLSFDSRSKQLGTRGLKNTVTEKQSKVYPQEKHAKKHTSSKLEMQKHSTVGTKGIVKSYDSIPTTSSPGLSVSVSSWKVQTSSHCNVVHENWKTLVQTSINLIDEGNGSGPKITSAEAVPGPSKSLNTKTDINASSSSKRDIVEEDVRMKKGCTGSKVRKDMRKDDDAKSEIQSLVKLNLQLLNRHKRLGINTFKEVARLATHTILAACGFEHSRHVFHSPPCSICSHSERVQQLLLKACLKMLLKINLYQAEVDR